MILLAMLGRKKVAKRDASDETYLQYLLSHPMYDAFILAVILLNCVALCISDPKVPDDEQLYWLQDLNWFFNVCGRGCAAFVRIWEGYDHECRFVYTRGVVVL